MKFELILILIFLDFTSVFKEHFSWHNQTKDIKLSAIVHLKIHIQFILLSDETIPSNGRISKRSPPQVRLWMPEILSNLFFFMNAAYWFRLCYYSTASSCCHLVVVSSCLCHWQKGRWKTFCIAVFVTNWSDYPIFNIAFFFFFFTNHLDMNVRKKSFTTCQRWWQSYLLAHFPLMVIWEWHLYEFKSCGHDLF